MYLQSPLRLFARIFAAHSHVSDEHGDDEKNAVPRTHFAASVMSQVVPVNIKLAVIIHVYELVCQGVFHVALAAGMVLA
jgi:hypothetical protein